MGNQSCCQTPKQSEFDVINLELDTNKTNKCTEYLNNFLDKHPFIAIILEKLKDKQKSEQLTHMLINKDIWFDTVIEKGFSSSYQCQNFTEGVFISKDHINGRQRNSYGILLYEADGENDSMYYEGYWKENLRNYWGVLISQNGDFYIGGWEEDMPHQIGHYKSSNTGTEYIGRWSNGMKDGQGRENYPDGSYYQGQFQNNQINGQGKYKGLNQNYQGSWKDGKMHGNGKAQWFDQKGNIIATYIGEYYQGKKEGFGQYTDSKGFTYKAKWVDGQINEQAPIMKQLSAK